MGAPADRPASVVAGDHARAIRYIREKVDQLLEVMGTSPLRAEELDDATLIDLDPIGIVANSFRQVLEHLNRTNKQLEFAHSELQAIFDSVGLGILVIDRDHRVQTCNSQLRHQFGRQSDCPMGENCNTMICGLSDPETECPFLEVFATGQRLDQQNWRVGGRIYDVVATPVTNDLGEVTNVVLVYADITERIQSEEALRRSEEKYRDLFENANDLVVSFRLDGSLEYVNAAFYRTLGYEERELAGVSLLDLLHEDCATECRSHLDNLLHGEGEGAVRAIFRRRDGGRVVVQGDVRLVRVQGRPVGARGILRDVTEHETFAEELLKREKLESIGLLAGGIAHDFNNILTAVIGNISLALALTPEGERVHDRLLEAERAAGTARDLTHQLLTFAKGGAPVRGSVSLEGLLRDQASFACRGSNVKPEINLPSGLWPVEIDEGQIGQVVHNLVLNAVQSMPVGGKVRLAAANIEACESTAPFLPPGRYVRFTVADSGVGIPREHLQRMFDPYFTTKKGGSGLGLAVSYSIVKKHDGHIRVESESGRGATFEVWLPASAVEPTASTSGMPGVVRGSGRVLLMDDEPLVRDTASQMLLEIGYEVDTSADGAEAVRLYREAGEKGLPYDVVIMDLTVPGGIGGREALEKIRQIDPEVRAIVSSGYSTDPVMGHYAEHGFRGVIVKPYRLADLSAVLERVIHGGRAASR